MTTAEKDVIVQKLLFMKGTVGIELILDDSCDNKINMELHEFLRIISFGLEYEALNNVYSHAGNAEFRDDSIVDIRDEMRSEDYAPDIQKQNKVVADWLTHCVEEYGYDDAKLVYKAFYKDKRKVKLRQLRVYPHDDGTAEIELDFISKTHRTDEEILLEADRVTSTLPPALVEFPHHTDRDVVWSINKEVNSHTLDCYFVKLSIIHKPEEDT